MSSTKYAEKRSVHANSRLRPSSSKIACAVLRAHPVRQGPGSGWRSPSSLLKSAREASMGLVSSDDGWRMPDWLWERVGCLLPARPSHPLGCHRPRVSDRSAMDAILLVLRTGMQWNALNDRDLLV